MDQGRAARTCFRRAASLSTRRPHDLRHYRERTPGRRTNHVCTQKHASGLLLAYKRSVKKPDWKISGVFVHKTRLTAPSACTNHVCTSSTTKAKRPRCAGFRVHCLCVQEDTGTTAILCTLLPGMAEKRPFAGAAYSKTPRYVSIRVHCRSAQEDASTMVIVHCRSGQIPLIAILEIVRPGGGTAPDGNAQGGCENNLAQTSFVHENMHLGHLWCTNGRQKSQIRPISGVFVHKTRLTAPSACTNHVCTSSTTKAKRPRCAGFRVHCLCVQEDTGTTAILCTLLPGMAEKRPFAGAAYSKTPRYVSIRVHFRSAHEDAGTMVIVRCRSGQIPLIAVLGAVRPGGGTAPGGSTTGWSDTDGSTTDGSAT